MRTKEKKATAGTVEHERKPFGDIFAINTDNLEVEAQRQIELMSEYSEAFAEAEFEVHRLEERKKTYRSEIIERVESGEETMPGRRAADAVEAHYRVDPKYKAIAAKLNEAIYNRDRLQGAMYTLAQRRDMLQMFNQRQIASSNLAGSIQRSEAVHEAAKNRVRKQQRVGKEG